MTQPDSTTIVCCWCCDEPERSLIETAAGIEGHWPDLEEIDETA